MPIWSHNGIICTGETYTPVVKLISAMDASLDDPTRLFKTSLQGNTRRAIDGREAETINGQVFISLVRAAIALNGTTASARRQRQPRLS